MRRRRRRRSSSASRQRYEQDGSSCAGARSQEPRVNISRSSEPRGHTIDERRREDCNGARLMIFASPTGSEAIKTTVRTTSRGDEWSTDVIRRRGASRKWKRPRASVDCYSCYSFYCSHSRPQVTPGARAVETSENPMSGKRAKWPPPTRMVLFSAPLSSALLALLLATTQQQSVVSSVRTSGGSKSQQAFERQLPSLSPLRKTTLERAQEPVRSIENAGECTEDILAATASDRDGWNRNDCIRRSNIYIWRS